MVGCVSNSSSSCGVRTKKNAHARMETCRCNALARGNAAADGLPQSVHCASGAPFERVPLSISMPGMTSPSHNRLVSEAATSSPRPRARIAASVGRAGQCRDCSLQTGQPLLQRTKSNPFLVVTITCTYTLITHFRTSGPSHMCIHSAVGTPIPRGGGPAIPFFRDILPCPPS